MYFAVYMEHWHVTTRCNYNSTNFTTLDTPETPSNPPATHNTLPFIQHTHTSTHTPPHTPRTHTHPHNNRPYLHHSNNVDVHVCNLINHYYYSMEDIYEAF